MKRSRRKDGDGNPGRVRSAGRVTRENLEVREEVLGTQMDDEGSDGPRLVEGIVDEETPCGERTERPYQRNFRGGRRLMSVSWELTLGTLNVSKLTL